MPRPARRYYINDQASSERGYAGLRINDIAEASGVAKTTIYRRWADDDHLVVGAMELTPWDNGRLNPPREHRT